MSHATKQLTKEYRFDETDRVKIRFSPISNLWFLWQKILDGLVLGIIAGIIVFLLTEYRSKQRSC